MRTQKFRDQIMALASLGAAGLADFRARLKLMRTWLAMDAVGFM
jgi:hypothetical protein